VSNILSFLERAGRDAHLRYASSELLSSALEQARIEANVRAAILGADSRSLESLMGASRNVCCIVQAPQDDEDEPEKQQPDKKQEIHSWPRA
jgi:hypothetical protein